MEIEEFPPEKEQEEPQKEQQEPLPPLQDGPPDVGQLATSLQTAAIMGDAPPAPPTLAPAAAVAAAASDASASEASVVVSAAADKGARADGLKERGNALADEGDFEGALRLFEEGISLLGAGTTAHGQHTLDAGTGGKPHDARSAVLWELKAQCHMQLEQWLEGVRAAERAVELSAAQWPEARHTLGRCLLLFGEVRAAVAELTALYGADPSNEEVRADLIDANAALGELQRREADYDLQLSGRAGLDARELEVCQCKRSLLGRGKAVGSDCTLGMDEEEEAAAAVDRARREGGEVGVGMEEGDEEEEA